MQWTFWRSWMRKTKKVPKEGLSIICSTKKNTTICWNKDSISPYRKGFQYRPDHENHPPYLALYEKYRGSGNFTENELFQG